MDHHHHNIPPPLAAATASWAFSWEPQEASRSTAAEEEELRQALLRAALELESTRAAAQEELRRMEGQAFRLARLLEAATRERDEARLQCHSLLLLLMNHQNPQHHQLPQTNPTPKPDSNPNQPLAVDESSNVVVPASSSSEEEEDGSNVSPSSPMPVMAAEMEAAAERRGLPEKGRLVEAVMGAGPLLQTLLLAGPLPQWRHPPPSLQSFEIPPVAMPHISSSQKREREELGFCGRSPSHSPSPPIHPSSSYSPDSNSSTKYQRIINPFHV